jgi:hypothetical protein
MKNKKYHAVGTFPNSNRKIVVQNRGKIMNDAGRRHALP